jgi:CPA1 family monovalent cation:H+ antiporter
LSLPLLTASGARFPAREQIIFITFSVIFINLVLQGPTLAPLLRWLGLDAGKVDTAEESHARLTVAEAGLRTLDDPALANSSHPEVVRYLRQRHRQRARRWAAREAQPDGKSTDIAHDHFVPAPSHDAGILDEDRAVEYRRVRSAMLAVEQDTVLALRDDGVIADDIMRRIQRDLDLETILLDTSEPVSATASDVPSSNG